MAGRFSLPIASAAGQRSLAALLVSSATAAESVGDPERTVVLAWGSRFAEHRLAESHALPAPVGCSCRQFDRQAMPRCPRAQPTDQLPTLGSRRRMASRSHRSSFAHS